VDEWRRADTPDASRATGGLTATPQHPGLHGRRGVGHPWSYLPPVAPAGVERRGSDPRATPGPRPARGLVPAPGPHDRASVAPWERGRLLTGDGRADSPSLPAPLGRGRRGPFRQAGASPSDGAAPAAGRADCPPAWQRSLSRRPGGRTLLLSSQPSAAGPRPRTCHRRGADPCSGVGRGAVSLGGTPLGQPFGSCSHRVEGPGSVPLHLVLGGCCLVLALGPRNLRAGHDPGAAGPRCG
jgi:hypothetical protein